MAIYKSKYTGEELEKALDNAQVQPDLSQNDPNAADYVKNRTHWVGIGTVIEEQTIEGFAVMENSIYTVLNPFIFSPIADDRYIVHWDGIAYDVEAQSLDGCLCLGNENYLTMNTGGDIPFAILVFEDGNIYIATESTANSHTICIEGEVVHKLDKKFLPDREEDIIFTAEYDTEVGWYRYSCNSSYEKARNAILHNESTPRMMVYEDNGSYYTIRYLILENVMVRENSMTFTFISTRDSYNSIGCIRYKSDGTLGSGVE